MTINVGDLLKIISGTEKGAKKVKISEIGARKGEAEQHKKIYDIITQLMGKTSKTVEDTVEGFSNIGKIFNFMAGGNPATQGVVEGITSFLGGEAGKLSAKRNWKDSDIPKLFANTKFGKEMDTFIEELGSDSWKQALVRGASTAGTAYASEKALGKRFTKTGGEKPSILDRITDKLPSEMEQKYKLNPISQVTQPILETLFGAKDKASLELTNKLLSLPKSLLTAGKGWGEKPLQYGGTQTLKNLLTQLYTKEEHAKMPSPYEYEMPKSIASPNTGAFGGYR